MTGRPGPVQQRVARRPGPSRRRGNSRPGSGSGPGVLGSRARGVSSTLGRVFKGGLRPGHAAAAAAGEVGGRTPAGTVAAVPVPVPVLVAVPSRPSKRNHPRLVGGPGPSSSSPSSSSSSATAPRRRRARRPVDPPLGKGAGGEGLRAVDGGPVHLPRDGARRPGVPQGPSPRGPETRVGGARRRLSPPTRAPQSVDKPGRAAPAAPGPTFTGTRSRPARSTTGRSSRSTRSRSSGSSATSPWTSGPSSTRAAPPHPAPTSVPWTVHAGPPL